MNFLAAILRSQLVFSIFCNIITEEVNIAEKGDIVYIIDETKHHTGYALGNKKFFHRTENGTRIDNIPFNPNGECTPGGIYFTDLENWTKWINYSGEQMYNIWDVENKAKMT